MPQINLLKKIKGKDTNSLDFLYKNKYEMWKKNQEVSEAKFFMLYKDFDIHLKDISSGALKLYIYYGFHAKNLTGELWHGVDRIKDYFDVTERTINLWNKELEERGLIARVATKHKSKTTYLLPFSPNLVLENNDSIDSFIKSIIEKTSSSSFKEVYGNISAAFHMFQWRKSQENRINKTKEKNKHFDQPYHELIIIFTKEFEKEYCTENNTYFKACHHTAFRYRLNNNEIKTVVAKEELDYETDMCIFKSDIKIDPIEVDIKGIAINSKYNLKELSQLKAIVSQLMHPDMNLNLFKKVSLTDMDEIDFSENE